MTDRVLGAHWIRAALQVNPYLYEGRNQPSSTFANESDYNRALLDECVSLGIDLIAVTDHWCVDSAEKLISEANERGIVALPGFEANSSEGVHILVIFEAGTELSAVNAAIGACGVTPRCANGTTGIAFKDILEKMTQLGALVIPAHVNVANGGMLTGRTGSPLVSMVKDSNLHAIAITASQPEAADQESVIESRKPFDRKHPLSVIYADDIVHPDQLKSEGSTTWFKVSSSRVESLKLAVRTPQTRVALKDPTGVARALLREISWTGGFLDGVTIPISSDLTTLIGGRGTGKSTVIESLRYALALEPIGKDALTDHKAVVDKVIRTGTVIRVEVDAVSPIPQRFTIERIVPNPPVVRDASGTVTSLLSIDVAGLVEVFGQHELAELASSPENVADMLRRLAGTGGLNADHQSVVEKLALSRSQLSQAENALSKLKEELADIPRLAEQVKHFAETDVAKRLSDLNLISRDEAIFKEAALRVESVKVAINNLKDGQFESSLKSPYQGSSESPESAELVRVAEATTKLADTLSGIIENAESSIALADSELNEAKAAWDLKVKDRREGHDEVLRKLHEEGLEPDKYLAISKALDELKAKEPRLATQVESLKKMQSDRDELLGLLASHEKSQVEVLHEAIRAANAATGGVVVVRPMPAPDRDDIVNVISSHISGNRTQITAAVQADDFSPRAFAMAIRKGALELAKYGIKGAQAANLIAAGEDLARELEELSVGHAVEVLLDISTSGGERELKKMDDLSKGQRATALLLLLLSSSTAPLIIDQPEDDLDNRFVYDGVVSHLRKLKGVRQVIASTHNANVPVLGDAELIIALDGNGRNGSIAPGGIGSLDDASIRNLAENLLEGGPAAFNARQHLYGF